MVRKDRRPYSATSRQFDLPVFLFYGAADKHTLTSLATEYFAAIEAPAKDMVLIPDGGHCVVLAQPDVFLSHLLAHVAPLAEPVNRG